MEMIAPYSAVADAARPYESRWTLRALAVVDRALYDLFRDQQRLWEEALITGTDADIQEQTGCMCRGWAAITRRMEEAGVPDNAYMIGVDPKTGTRVAIGDQVAARDRVREIDGEKTIWITPHEVATMLASAQVLASMKGSSPALN